jgi:predicted small lipoprotein YifL
VKARRGFVLLLLLAVLSVGLAGCGKPAEAELPAASVPKSAAADTSTKYVGAWRAKDSTVVIKREGTAFIMEMEGPAGPKEVGAFENGVLRFGLQAALYTPWNDQLIFASKEYKRIDSQQQTIRDLKGIGQAIQLYTSQNQYNIPPVNDIDFFVGLANVYPEMSRQDGWGTRYRYLYKLNAPHWAVVSAGPDGVFEPILTAEMVAAGMIGTRGDDIVMVDGTITSGVTSRTSSERRSTEHAD